MSDTKGAIGSADVLAVNQLGQAQANAALNCAVQLGHIGLGYGYSPPPPPSYEEAVRVAKARLAQIEQQLAAVPALEKEAAKLKKPLKGAE